LTILKNSQKKRKKEVADFIAYLRVKEELEATKEIIRDKDLLESIMKGDEDFRADRYKKWSEVRGREKPSIMGFFEYRPTSIEHRYKLRHRLPSFKTIECSSFCINKANALIRVVKLWIFQICLIQFRPITI
jgi:hypothetical protein